MGNISNKEKVIRAIKKLIKDRYTDGLDIACPLCSIFSGCKGCPSACKGVSTGCEKQPTFFAWLAHSKDKILGPLVSKNRKVKWQKALPIIEKLPASRFTRRGWTFFYELQFMWDAVVN